MRCGGSTWKKGLLITAFVLIVFTVGAINFNNFEIYKGLKEDLAFGRSSNANESLAATPSIWAIALGSNLTWKLTVTILNAKRFISSRVWLSIRSLHPINAFAHILHLCSALRLQILHSLQHTAASQLRDTNSTLVPSTAVVTGPYSHSSALSQTRFPSKLISLIKSPIPASETIQPLISTTLLLSPANSSPQKFKVPFSSPSPSTMGLSPSPPTFPAPVSSSLPPDQTPEGPSSSASPPKPETSAIPPYLSPPSISPLLFTPLLESPRKPSQHAFGDPFSPFPYPSLAPLKEGGMLAPPVAHSSDQILSPADVHPPPKEVRSSLNSPAFSKTESPSTSSSFPPALAPVLAPRRPPSFSFSSLASPGSFPPVLSSAPAIENGHATYSMSSPVLPSSQPLSPLQAPLSLSIPSLSSKPPDSSPFLSFASPSSSPSTVPPTFSPAHGLDDATMPPKQAMSSLSSPSSLINALAPQQATSAEASLKSPISQAVASVMAPTGVSSDSPQSSNIIIPFTQSPSPAPARKDVSTPSQLAKANSPPNSPGFLDVQAPRQQAPVSGFLHAQPSSPPFENSSPQQPSFSDSPIFSTPSLPLAPTVTPSSFPFSRSPLLAPASDFENSPIPQASFSLGSPPSQKPAAPDSGSPPLLANAPSFLHSTPPPEIAIESTSPTPLHAPSALHTPAFSSTSSPIVAEGPALQDSGSPPFQAPSISNAPSFLHSMPPPEIAIESTSPTPLHAPSSLPTPSNPQAFSSTSSPPTVMQGPASQGSGSFQAPSISSAPSFFHSTPPPEVATQSISPTPLHAPSSLPSPGNPQAFSSTSSPIVAEGPALQDSPVQAPSIINAPNFFHSTPPPELATKSTSPTPLETPSSLSSPSNPQTLSSTSSPTVAPASRQTSYPATSKNFPFPIHHTPSAAPRTNHIYPPSQQAPVYAASPNNFHSQAPSSAPKPLVVLAPLQASIHFLPPSPLLSSVSSPSTQPSSPASTVSMSPSLSVIEKHAPAPLQPPVMNPVPPPHTVPQPLLAPLPSMPQNPVHPPLLGRPSPLPSIVLSPVAAPGSPKFDRSSGPSSPLSLGRHAHSPPNVPPTLEASSPVLSRDTNNELAPASTSHHSMSPTTGLHSMPPETSNELAPASTSRSSMSPPTGLHSMPPEQLRKPLQPAPSVAPTAPVQVNSTASSHSSKADSGHHVPAMPPTMIYFPPPPNSECQQMCTDPYTSTPGSPCGCVIPMLVGLELSTTLYSLFPLVSELAQELAAGTFLSQSQVRIMGANTVSDNVDKTEVKADLVPLALSFDHRTALSIAQRFWSHQVFINETLFGNYSLLYIQYPGLPPSPPSRDSVGPDSGILNGGNQASIAQPLSVDIAKSHSRLSGGTIAIIALSSIIAAVIFVGVTWIFILRFSQYRQPPAMIKPATGSSTTKRSGGGSVRSSSLGGSESMSSASGLTACSASSKTFTLAELENATKNFRPERVIGEGGFGRVYWGTLEDGTKVAVKVLTRDDQQGVREFAAEVEMLSRLHHRNLVKLLGICTEENVRCLVYELIPNGSVEFHLHGDYERPASLNWEVRLKIALGSARGLAYLHEDSIPRVIHRDFKSSNILLEDDFNPKVSDFGLAKAASEEMGGHVSTRVMGTFGYVAPEYAMTGHLLVKSDVYSYGVVLLELLSGRKPVDMSRPSGEENLVTWARPLLRSKEGLMKLVDPVLGDDFPLDNLVKVAAIASMCVHPEVSNRPFMGEVVQALKLVYNDSEASDGALSRNDSIGGESSLRNSDSKLSLGQVLRSNSMYLPDATSFITVDYDSGSLEDIRTPVSASGTLSNSGRFIRQSSGSFERHNSSGPLTTVRSNLAWYRIRHHGGGTLSEHGLGMQHADKHYTDIWP
ncbi:hypothetical protein O6H91_02G040700 [Diphasiastrum complanatum]|uniref:Uncharacterized protein n=1 Tax=Diphasiastrum complanatum TaxID=34168 RepID=A0ACC2EEN9_DIPCM|nr:hypothetical protein O6H91_02G040700 [Diphasiastrum complanatum]